MSNDPRSGLPTSVIRVVVLLSALPVLLMLAGADLGLTQPAGDPLTALSAGYFVHTLLEWSAVAVALFTAVLAFLHFGVTRDRVAPVLGLALLTAGLGDAFHVVASHRLVGSADALAAFVPFTWVASRLFVSLAIVVGGATVLLWTGRRSRRGWVWVGAGLVLAAAGFVYLSAGAAVLPRTFYPAGPVARPWELVPLALFVLAGVGVLPLLYRRHPSPLSHALLWSMVPHVVAQLHIGLGHTALYDAHFNAAHFLKLLAYMVPLWGLVLAYVQTERREIEERVARAAAEAANRAKSEFLASISHELRTPLNAVIGYTELLEVGVPEPIPDSARERVARIRLSARHLLHLIDGILSFSRDAVQAPEPVLESVDCGDLIGEVVAMIQPLAEAKGLRFTAARDGVPRRIRTDPQKLLQILLNLLGNAVKFTERGEVGLVARATSGTLFFDVRDTGIGITRDEEPLLFEPFWQADRSTTRSAGGAGLGLAISRQLASALGGVITVASEPGVGSTFTLALPVARATGRTTPHLDRPTDRATDRATDQAVRVEAGGTGRGRS